MRATTNGGNLTLPTPAGGVKSGVPIYLSDSLAGVPQSDYSEGNPMAIETTGIECTVEVAAAVNAYQPLRINAAGVVSVGAPAAGYAKLGVAKFDSVERTRDHVVTLEESEDVGGPYEGEEVGSIVDETYNVVKVIVQSI